MSPNPFKKDLPKSWYKEKAKNDAELKRIELYGKIFWTALNIALLAFVITALIWTLRTAVKTFIVGGLL